jgi:hypothetical protein
MCTSRRLLSNSDDTEITCDIVYAVNRTLVTGLDEFRIAIDALHAGDAVSSSWNGTVN